MWLAESIYEKLPQFWFFAGVIFISAGLYLGFAFESTIWYIGLGFVCCLCGIGIFTMRQRYHQKSHSTVRSVATDR